jgi:hypothetical protein
MAAADRAFLSEVFRTAPAEMASAPAGGALEAFHRDLIRNHLERDLRSTRVLKDVAREMRG